MNLSIFTEAIVCELMFKYKYVHLETCMASFN